MDREEIKKQYEKSTLQSLLRTRFFGSGVRDVLEEVIFSKVAEQEQENKDAGLCQCPECPKWYDDQCHL